MKRFISLLTVFFLLVGCVQHEEFDNRGPAVEPTALATEQPNATTAPTEAPSAPPTKAPLKTGLPLIRDLLAITSKAGVTRSLGTDFQKIRTGANGKLLGYQYTEPDLTVVFRGKNVSHIQLGSSFAVNGIKIGRSMSAIQKKFSLSDAKLMPYGNEHNFAKLLTYYKEGLHFDFLSFDNANSCSRIVISKTRTDNQLIEKVSGFKMTDATKSQLIEKTKAILAAQIKGDASYKSLCTAEFCKKIKADKMLFTSGFEGQPLLYQYIQKNIITEAGNRFYVIVRIEKDVTNPALSMGYFANYFFELDNSGDMKLYDIQLDV